MSYYMGDFYGGMRGYGTRYIGYGGPGVGDPGFFSFLGGIAKKAVGFIPGVGPALSAGLSMIKTGGAKSAVRVGSDIVTAAKTAVIKHPVMSAAGAAGAIGVGAMAAGAAIEHRVGGRGKCKHLTPSGKCRRRMNVCNPRALRRAIRRTHGFAKLAMKSIHIIHPKKKGRFGGFKRRRRK